MSQTRRTQIEAMLVDMPDDPELRYMLAMEYASEGDDISAVQCFEELLRRTADYPPAYHMAGRALARLNRIDEAKKVLERGIPAAMKKGDQHAAGEMQELLASFD